MRNVIHRLSVGQARCSHNYRLLRELAVSAYGDGGSGFEDVGIQPVFSLLRALVDNDDCDLFSQAVLPADCAARFTCSNS